MSTEAKLQSQNERFELLLNLTTRITSSLDLREVSRTVAANIREAIHADAVVVSLLDAAAEKCRVFAVQVRRDAVCQVEQQPSWATAEGIKTSCFIPLVNRGRALGV